ncbi:MULTISPECIES: hypothetical protein [unclassified Salinibacterium]|uniref:hypothetical protein n=1 Tax=unclassified Salinibacterium TaxID=2632331 RepID=UPI0027D9CFA5|nr:MULTISPECIES: hypothetical protein [unclassified Salinibacterium]
MTVTQQATNVVQSLRAALLVIATLLAVVALLAMHSAAAGAAPAMTGHAIAQSAAASHDSEPSSAEHCPCPSDSDSSMSMVDCTPVAALTGVVAPASLRSQCALAGPLTASHSQSTGAILGAPAPSLHALSINRT